MDGSLVKAIHSNSQKINKTNDIQADRHSKIYIHVNRMINSNSNQKKKKKEKNN